MSAISSSPSTADFASSLATTIETLHKLGEIRSEIDRAGEMILATLRRGGKLLICGNGGSAAEAAHFATELVGRYQTNRSSLPAIALTSDGSLITCILNDFGADSIFARQVNGFAKPEDLLVVISSSGNSSNIIAALNAGAVRNIKSIAFLGRGGGVARGLATCELVVPGDDCAACQEVHLFLIHHFCRLIDREFIGNSQGL